MRISLRLKLALISLLLLTIPYTGVRLAGIVQESLLESRKEALIFSARAVASALNGREGLFDKEHFLSLDQRKDLYLFQLTSPMRLNGKIDDWQPHLNEAETFGSEHILSGHENFSPQGAGFTHLIGRRGNYLYAVFIVTDDSVIYRQKNSLSLDRSDHLRIVIEDKSDHKNQYIVTTDKAGWVNGFLMANYGERLVPKRSESRIQGVWQPGPHGYTIELRIPLELIGKRLAFAIGDVDDQVSREISTIIGTATLDQPEEIGWLLSRSSTMREILESLNKPRSRIQIIDSNQHIRASYGALTEDNEDGTANTSTSPFFSSIYTFLSPLFHLFTEPFGTTMPSDTAQPSELNIEGVAEALLGSSSTSSYRLPEVDIEIMAAITPLYDKGKIVGAVVVEQTTNSILALKNRVIEESIILALLVLFFGGCGLLFFAFRVSFRIRQLRDQASSAIGRNGQILDIATPSSSRDEIGDLSRTLHSILSQLKAMEQYREKMADNLEHEMRTPLASISASLKNLAKELEGQPEHILNYVTWALRDIKRMEDLLSAIRDATSLKNALDQGFKERFNLSEALSMWLQHSWRTTFSDVQFQLTLPDEGVHIDGDPDKIRQMLDKLIENSVAFHEENTPITLQVQSDSSSHTIEVVNTGPSIPDEMLEEIFNSMVSARSKKDNKPHLGLGLFIVRTIAHHHEGEVFARNISGDVNGVCFSVRLPRLNLLSAK